MDQALLGNHHQAGPLTRLALLARRDFTVTSRKFSSPAHQLPLKFVDPKVVLDESEKWGKLYNEIIARQSR